jgi:hypothetical protein
MNLQQLRDYIRAQLDVDEEELPNALTDIYLAEAFMRTISQENRWPFYETRWDVAKVDSDPTITLPADCDPPGIDALIDANNGYRLMQIANELAEDRFIGMAATANNPSYFSLLGREIYLWPSMPTGSDARNYHLRGHRYSKDWIAEGASGIPDCDARLHQLLAHYAIALAYAQQEDEVLEDVYMKRWQSTYIAAHSAICAPRHHRPLVINGGLPYVPSYNPVVWGPPVGP